MKFDKEKKKNIVHYLLEKIDNNVENPSQIVAETFGVNRNTVHNYINELAKENIIARVKRGKYQLVSAKKMYVFERDKGEIQNETRIFDLCLKEQIKDLPANIRDIWSYAFSEMVNNVIDHSNSKSLHIIVRQNYLSTTVDIIDDGVGIFEKIKKHFDLPSVDDAVCELFKGKLTTDTKNHSGEGIFFTSRIMDSYTIWSSEKVFTHNKYDENSVIDFSKLKYGTFVTMRLSNFTHKKSQEIFDKFTNSDSNFSKTSISLKNIFDASPVSRSQARRVVSSLDKFEEAILDFEGVEWMGQGFAHQIFVVFVQQNPEIRIIPVNMNEDVTKMYNHVINTK